METIKAEINLESSQLKLLREDLKNLDLSFNELLNQFLQEYLSQISMSKNRSADDFMALIDLGKSKNSDVSQKHDTYLGGILENEHLR